MLAGKMMAAASAATGPTFVSSSSNQANSTSVTVTAPANILNGDLLIAITYQGGTVDTEVTPPSGFSQIENYQGGIHRTTVNVKTASSESGNYTFTSNVSAYFRASILVYRNATRVNTTSGINRTSSTDAVALSLTPTYEGVLLAAFSSSATSNSIATPPAGMTQRLAALSIFPHAAVYELSPQSVAASGDKTLVWANTSAVTGLQLQITNETTVAPEFVASASTENVAATGATLTINKPTGTIENDLMVAVMGSSNNSNTTWTGATGWTEVADQSAEPNVRVAYKVAGASEGSSYVFTNSSSASYLAGCILTYRYAAYDTVGSFTDTTNPLILPSISPSQSQSFLIATGGRNDDLITMGTPTSMTARVTANSNINFCYKVCDQTVPKGPVGTRSMSAPGTVGTPAGILLSIKPTRSL